MSQVTPMAYYPGRTPEPSKTTEDFERAIACTGVVGTIYDLGLYPQSKELPKLMAIPGLHFDGHSYSVEPTQLHRLSLKHLPGTSHYSRYHPAAEIARRACYNDSPLPPSITGPEWAAQFFWPIDEEFILSRSPQKQRVLLESLQGKIWDEGLWTERLQDAVFENLPFSTLALTLCLFRGERVTITPAHKKAGYEALQVFLGGDLAGAHERFLSLLKTCRKVAGPFPSLVALFARVAAMGVGDLVTARDPRLDHSGRFAAGHLLSVILAEATATTRMGWNTPPTGGLCYCFSWILRSFVQVDESIRHQVAAQYRGIGMECIAEQLQEHPSRPWIEWKVRKPWEFWLESLKGAGPKATDSPSKAKKSPNKADKLAWHLDDQGLLEAHRLTNRTTFPGRPVRLEMLRQKPPDYLSEQDKESSSIDEACQNSRRR